MNIIVPMAGMGKRMRPHSLTTPKPLIKVAGKSIVQRLLEDIKKMTEEPIGQIAFIIGEFGKEVEDNLLQIANDLGAKGSIHYQLKAEGTAHAILCAKEHLKGHVMVALADTLFYADFNLKNAKDGTIWVKEIEDPRQFGVVELNENGLVKKFHEKPENPVSNLAIIGIYHFNDGNNLRNELQFLIDNNLREKGEFQLTNALENMQKKGVEFNTEKVTEWLDCGNKDATVYTNQRLLEIHLSEATMHSSVKNLNAVIIPPCLVAANVVLKNCVIGPHVTIGENSKIENSIIRNSIIQNNVNISNKNIADSMIGSFAELKGRNENLSIGDYSVESL